MLLKLAMLNLLRNKRRTVLSTVAIVIGVFYLILGQSMVGGIEEGIIKAAEDGISGHLYVRPADYPTVGLAHPVEDLVDLPPAAAALLAREATATTGRTLFAATLFADGDSLRVRGIGYDPATDAEVLRRTTWKIGGDAPVPKDATDGVLVGSGVARLLRLERGDRLVIQTRSHPGAINALDTVVAGVLSSGNGLIDGTAIFAPKALADDLIRNPLPTHVVARLADRDRATELKQALIPLLGPAYEVVTWQEDTLELLRMQKLRRRALNVLVGVLLAMSAFAIANTTLMAAHERVREIGTLRAMGMTKAQVMQLFLLEGSIMGVGGALLGATLGAGMASYFAVHPIDLSQVGGGAMDNIPFSSFLYAQFEPSLVVMPVLVSAGVALLASLYPARLASTMVVADAVRAS